MNSDKRLCEVWRRLAVNLETEWRHRNGWIGDRRPEAIEHYIDREFIRLLNKENEGETEVDSL
jgi:hypothetical protein